MKRCFIYAAGTFYGLRERPRAGELQIAADAGLHLCERLGVRPDVVLGDFDSMDASEAPPDCIRVPVEKDDTDTMLALREGLRRGCDTFYLYDCDFVYTVIENETLALEREVDWGIVSLFSMGDRAEHITLEGLQYPLTDGTIDCGFPLGVSNHIVAPTARITVGRGPLLVGWELSKSEEE